MPPRERIVVELSNQDRHLIERVAKAIEKKTPELLPKPPIPIAKEYPYEDGDVIVLGPELFVYNDLRVLCYKGQEYLKPCGEFVRDLPGGGSSHCVKMVDHPRPLEHEDKDGHIVTGFAEEIKTD